MMRVAQRLHSVPTFLALVVGSLLAPLSIALLPATPAAADTDPIEVSSTNLDFGDVPIGDTAARTIDFTNVSNIDQPFSITGGAAHNEFTAGTNCPATLPAGDSCTLTYYYTPPTPAPTPTTPASPSTASPATLSPSPAPTQPTQPRLRTLTIPKTSILCQPLATRLIQSPGCR